jgi:hypothetical protein
MFAARPHGTGVSSSGWITFVLAELKDLVASPSYKAGVTFSSSSYETDGSGSIPAPGDGAQNYYSPVGSTPAVWVRCTLVSGDAPDNPTGVWIQASGSPSSWMWLKSTSGTMSAVVSFQLSTDSGGSAIVLDTGNINVTVTKP